jgi:hypothetical protein
MAHSHQSGAAAQPAPFLTEHENMRAVDLIERAERSAPYCLCGRHMLAVADGTEIWLECASRTERRSGLAGLVSRLTVFGHTRQLVMELPSAD